MKEKVKRKLDNFFEKIVEFYIYWAIIWLISYMVSTLFIKFYNFIERTSIASEFSETTKQVLSVETLQHQLLHNIVFTIVLVKAYKILMEYAEKKHINIKYTLEIAIIAPVVEVIFNYSSYEFQMLIFYWVLAVIMSIIYLAFYWNLRKVEEDYENEHK